MKRFNPGASYLAISWTFTYNTSSDSNLGCFIFFSTLLCGVIHTSTSFLNDMQPNEIQTLLSLRGRPLDSEVDLLTPLERIADVCRQPQSISCRSEDSWVCDCLQMGYYVAHCDGSIWRMRSVEEWDDEE